MFKVLSSTSRCFPDNSFIKVTLSDESITIFEDVKKLLTDIKYEDLCDIKYESQYKLLGYRKGVESSTLVKCNVSQSGSKLFLVHADGCPFDIGFVPIHFKIK